jgi:hypothetical protein
MLVVCGTAIACSLLRRIYPRHDFRSTTMKIRAQIIAASLMALGTSAQAQVGLDTLVDANGFIDVQKITCAQLANTYQEDADALTNWYSGWYNGLAKKHFYHMTRVKPGEHSLIVYCKANHGRSVIEAMDTLLKEEKLKMHKE